MSTLLDIIGAGLIAVIMLLQLLTMNANLHETDYSNTTALTTQTNTVVLARMIEYDVLKMGYHTPKPSILTATSDTLVFKADLRNNGTVNTVKYYLGALATSTRNPYDRVIYRVVDGSSTMMTLGVTAFTMTYFNADGATTSVRDSIRSINVKFTVKSTVPIDTTYSAAYWQKKLYPKNL
jgi:hypothetical protein